MADYVRRERNDTDPFPLRHATRGRPLTEHELRAIYGHSHDDGAARQLGNYVSPPGVVRPADWGVSQYVPPPQPYATYPAYTEPAVADYEEDLRIPLRRSRWGWAVVVAVVAAAGGLLVYAVSDRSETLRALGLARPSVVVMSSGDPVEREAIALTPMPVAIQTASAEPNAGAEATEDERPSVARAARRPTRWRAAATPPVAPRETPAAPQTGPYPDLEQGRSLDQVQKEIDQSLGIDEKPPAAAEQKPETDAPGEQRPSRDNPYGEEEPAPTPAPPSDDIVRDPGF